MIVTIYRVQDYQVPIVIPRWPPKIQDGRHKIFFFTFKHQTAVISRASLRSPCWDKNLTWLNKRPNVWLYVFYFTGQNINFTPPRHECDLTDAAHIPAPLTPEMPSFKLPASSSQTSQVIGLNMTSFAPQPSTCLSPVASDTLYDDIDTDKTLDFYS